MTKQQLQTVVLLLLFVFSLLKSILPVRLETDGMGYDCLWYVCVFAEAAYVRRFGVPFLEKRGGGIALYLGSSLLIFCGTMIPELSAYAADNNLQGQEVILYGQIPSLSYYLQMPSAFNPWSDLDSYSVEQMTFDLAETADGMEREGGRPVIIVEREYTVWMTGGVGALEELGVGERRINEIAQDQKWELLLEFMEEQGYEQDFSNGKFTVYR